MLFPNPSLGVNLSVVGLVLSFWLSEPFPKVLFTAVFIGLILAQIGMFVVGAMYTKHGLRNLSVLGLVPVFLLWKMIIDIVAASGRGPKKWARTQRISEQ